MIFQQFLNEESGCLSYLLGCGEAGEAIVVDPGRDRIDDYLRVARRKALRITGIVETHTHADHISGNRDLASATGAGVWLHVASPAIFAHDRIEDGQELRAGSVALTVLHTPGHTPDSVCLLVTDRARGGSPWFVLTGDTLFIGDVGRPDLGGASAAGDLYDSLQRVLLRLDDSIEVYPGHGAGSMCGRAMSSKPVSTIGFERRFNAALRVASRGEFVERLMQGLPPKPPSFELIVGKNSGLIPLAAAKPEPRTPAEVRSAVAAGACVLDLRDSAAFGAGHVPGALNVWLDGNQFAERVAWLAPPGAPLYLVGLGPGDVERAVQALSRVGVDQIAGFLPMGMIDWKNADLPAAAVPQLTVYDLQERLEEGQDLVVIDVREPSEWRAGHIAGAVHVPMLEARARRGELPADRPKAVVCAAGLRSSAVISVLAREGLTGFFNVTGGMTAWQKAGYPVVAA